MPLTGLTARNLGALALGFSLGNIGFGDFGEVHRMFTLRDFRLLLVFSGAVLLTAVCFRLFCRFMPGRRLPRRIFHRGLVPGSILFGLGWALCGCCPSIVFVQLGQGQLCGLWTLMGMLFGTWLFDRWNARYLHWDTHSCGV